MYTLSELESKTFGALKKIGYELNVLPEGDRRRRETWIDAIAGVNLPLLQLLEVSPTTSVEQVHAPIIETVETSPGVEPEVPLESKFGRIVYPRPAQEAIEHAAEASPAASIVRVSEPVMEAVKPSPRAEVGQALESIEHAAEASPGVEVDRVQEPIEHAVKTSPGVEVDPVQKPFMETVKSFTGSGESNGNTMETDGSTRAPQLTYTRTHLRYQRLDASRGSGGGDELESFFAQHKRSDRLLVAAGNDQRGWRQALRSQPNELAAKNRIEEDSDRNPTLTGIPLSDRFVARYCPPQSESIHFHSDADGQLSLIDFTVQSQPEPPDPDDFESLDAFREVIARWDAEHPTSSSDHCSDYLPNSVHCEPNSVHCEPLEVSLDSFCEWAPCPDEWYEPATLLEQQSKVSELSPGCKSSITSDFSIPTFGRLGDRPDRSDEPPDTGIFARLPKPKPPNFPPQAASWTQVGHKLDTSWTQGNEASRNYPEAIPKLSHRIAAGRSAQPARSPPGGDAV